MIIIHPCIATDIYQETPQHATPDPTPYVRPTSPSFPSSFLAFPTEIRIRIYHHYLLSLNLPKTFFAHLTMLGYWSDASSVVTRCNDRGYNLGRRISKPLLSLLLLNRQIHAEAEEVLYRAFVFCIPPKLASPDGPARLLRRQGGARFAQRLRNMQVNLSLNSRFWRAPLPAVVERWRAALTLLATWLPELCTVGLAVDYAPRKGADERTRKQMLDLIVSLARIFKHSIGNVHLRFGEVEYDRDGYVVPVSFPPCAEMLEEEKLLLRLRDDDKLLWYRVAMHFQDPSSELYSVEDLQARYAWLTVRPEKAELEAECLRRLKEGAC